MQKVFARWQLRTYAEYSKSVFVGESSPLVGNEIHALSSAAKPVCTWAARDAIQDCREATGGHGYLKGKRELLRWCAKLSNDANFKFDYFTVSRFGDLRNDNDPNCTYEGENNVLIQQTSNWLLATRRNGYDKFRDVSPLGTAQFLANFDAIMKQKFQCANAGEAIAVESKKSPFLRFHPCRINHM